MLPDAASRIMKRKGWSARKTREMVLRQMNAHWDGLVNSMDQLRIGGKRKWTGKTGTGKP